MGGKIGTAFHIGAFALLGLLIPIMFVSLVLHPNPQKLAPAPFVSTSTYLHMCDTALGEIRWVGGVPLCFIDLGKYRQ